MEFIISSSFNTSNGLDIIKLVHPYNIILNSTF